MKTKYSIRLFSGLLLSLALFFTSCTKEELQVPQQVNPENQAHALNASSVSQSVLKTTNSWLDCGGTFTTSTPMVVVFVANFKVEDKSDYLRLELYQSVSNGSLALLSSNPSPTGTASVTWTAMPGVVYYIKLSFPYLWIQWLGKMELGVPYWVSFPAKIPANSKAASVFITYP